MRAQGMEPPPEVSEEKNDRIEQLREAKLAEGFGKRKLKPLDEGEQRG